MNINTSMDRYPTRGALGRSSFPRQDPVIYPSGGGPLDEFEMSSFEQNGFLTFKHLLDQSSVSELKEEIENLARDPERCGTERVILEPGSKEVRSIFELHKISPLVKALAADERLIGPVRQVLGSDVYIHQSRANLKPGFEGKEFAWHSDFETWHAEDGMAAARAVSISIALTPNYVYNGSLMIIPGSHRTFIATPGETPDDHYRTSLRAQEVGVPSREALQGLVDEAGEIATITGNAGSAVMFDCNCMHGSAGNITPYPRLNIFIVYNSVENVLVEPFAAPGRRPTFIASREFTPIP